MHHCLFLLHKCSSRFSWLLPATLTDRSFISRQSQCCVVQGKAIIKIIATVLCFLLSCPLSTELYTSGTGNCSEILMAVFSSPWFLLKPVVVVKVLQTPPTHHIFTAVFVEGLEPALQACTRALEDINLGAWISVFLYFLDELWMWNTPKSLCQKDVQCVDSQPISLVSTGTSDIISTK